MEKLLKLYTYVDGVNDTPFPNADEQIIIGSFTYRANRMGGAPSITATVKHRLCLDDIWTDTVYAEFNGEKYFVRDTPSSSKSNDDTRYEHDLELLSERDILNHVYFIDAVQGDSSVDVYKSNSTEVLFFGDIQQFAGRLNASLSYSGLDYTAVVDEGITSENKQVQFSNQYILQALQEEFRIFEIPYYFVGKVIHFGFTSNDITTVLKYGYDSALLSISKDNANYQVINRITGTGSSDNIPYYYPNQSPKGVIGIEFVKAEHLTQDALVIVDMVKFAEKVPLGGEIVYSHQDLSPVVEYWTVNGVEYTLDELGLQRKADSGEPIAGDTFKQVQVEYITPSQNLLPPIYRETKGAQRFYNAQNNTYQNSEGEYYVFENEYSQDNPKEGITTFEDIKPTITGVTNSSGQRIDSFIEFAYDANDSDEVDEEGNYLHPYFFAKMRRTNGTYGFNLFDQAIEQQAMQISFTSGICGACTFEIAVGDESQKNLVQVNGDGTLQRDEDGNVLCGREDLQQPQIPQDRQNDTRNYEVWIALRKDDTTYPQVMPNANYNYKPSASDTFVILGINLPEGYILKAEQDLKDALINHMWLNNVEKFTFSAKFSRIFFTENPYVLDQLNENARVIIEYNGKQHTMYIDEYTYKMDSTTPLPEIDVNLVDTLNVGQNSLETQLDGVKQEILSTIGGGGDFLKQGLKYFLRKDVPDSARSVITFRRGLKIADFIAGSLGGNIDAEANAELKSLILREALNVLGDIEGEGNLTIEKDIVFGGRVTGGNFLQGSIGSGIGIYQDDAGNWHIESDYVDVRMRLTAQEVEIQRVYHIAGAQMKTAANMICVRVEEHDTFYRCYMNTTDDDGNEITNDFKVNDQAYVQTFNLVKQADGTLGNHFLWRLVIAVGSNYIDLSKDICAEGSDAPKAGDDIIQLGYRGVDDPGRQSAVIDAGAGNGAPYYRQYTGINSFTFPEPETQLKPGANILTGAFKFSSTGKDVEESLNSLEEEAKKAAEDAANAISEAQAAKDRLDEWAADGVISPLEKQSLKDEIARIDADKNDINADYVRYTLGTPTAYNNAYNSYRGMLVDLTSTATENIPIPSNFATVQENYYSARTTSLNAIAQAAKQNADDAKTAAEEAKEDAAEAAQNAADAIKEAQDAANRLDQWAADGVISPTEKQSLKDEIVRIEADYDEINEGYSRYNLGTPSSYNSAYNSYRSVLSTLSASSPETIPIPSYFESRQSSYYAQRTNALNAIAQAAKNNVDNIGDTVKNEVIVEIGDTIETTVRKEVTNQTGTFMEETESKFRQTDEEISAALKRITTTEQEIDTANGTINLLRTEVNNVSTQFTADGIFTLVSGKVTETAEKYADDALSAAQKDAASKYTTTTAFESGINQLKDQISLTSSKVTTVQDELGNLKERVSGAELKITPNAIVSTVSSNLQIGGTNFVKNSNFSAGWEYWAKNSSSASFKTDTIYGSYIEFSTPGVADAAANRIYQEAVFKAGVKYTISCVAKASSNVTIRLGRVTENSRMAKFNVSTSWKRYYATTTFTSTGAMTIDMLTANVKLSITQIKVEEGDVATSWTPAPDELLSESSVESAMVQTPNGFTFYGKEFDIKTSILTTTNLAAVNITTNKLTATTGAKIGGWVVNGSNLEATGNNDAQIRVEPSGTKFLRINSSRSTLLEMRADSMTGLRIYTQDTLGTCVNLMAQTGGIAMESHGNMALDARQGESIQLNGDVRVQGLTLGTTRRGANYQVLYNETFISIPYGCTITLPANPPIGRVVIAASSTTSTVTYTAATGFIMHKGVYQTSWQDTNDHSWNIFIWDGTYWQRLLMKQ